MSPTLKTTFPQPNALAYQQLRRGNFLFPLTQFGVETSKLHSRLKAIEAIHCQEWLNLGPLSQHFIFFVSYKWAQ
jgi:hypothetical protein